MDNKKLFISIILILGMIGVIYFLIKQQEERYFSQIPIEYDINFVSNDTDMGFLDTIAYVGMSKLGIEGNLIKFIPLSDEAKEQFKKTTEKELGANIIYEGGVSYIFIDKMTREEALLVMSHEFQHIQQYTNQRLKLIGEGKVIWLGDTLYALSMNYDDRPWEIEAFRNENKFKDTLMKVLYQK